MLWNRWDEVVESGDVRAAIRRRFHALVDAAGLDEEGPNIPWQQVKADLGWA